ncbi:hypothetical protein L21SP2_3162 [Salinispira pacifica]|uniref:Transposase n=2 Tax=Salinispira pacifica TaxID=1307761 RepID=V5WL12_9SPIO|nr:hypothetical protein L21SP2_3162 [Salinispira pacifica]
MADVFVRYLLGSESNKDILIDFLNAVFSHKGHELVVDLEIRNPFNLTTIQESKESILDIKAKDRNGRWINVEVQVSHEPSYAARSLYYWAKSYTDQLSRGDVYSDLSPSVCINLLDFTLFPELSDFHSCFQITEKDHKEYILTEHLEIHFIELSKLDFTAIPNFETAILRWCYYFKNEGNIQEDTMPVLLKDNPAIEKAHHVYEDFTSDEQLMDMAEAHEKWVKDVNTRLKTARQQGLEQGLEQARIEDAKKMLQEGLDIALICRITGLNEDQIKKLT